jgi:two-component system heavy metal sensor histidine kinase CusS
MRLRSRLLGAVAALTLLTLGGAFATVFFLVNRSQERLLDEALIEEAEQEAATSAAMGGETLIISNRPGPAINDARPLTKFAAIYEADGSVATATETFKERPPILGMLKEPPRRPFDLWFDNEHLRGVLVPVAAKAPHTLLFAAPRSDVNADAMFLGRAMSLVFLAAFLWAVAIAAWLVRRMTSGHEEIAAVARRVAAGDLTARVPIREGKGEVEQLARDVNMMISQLSTLVSAQQEFVAYAAHELRSPLTTLYGELSHALRRSRDAEAYRQAIEESLDGARRLKTLAEDLLALARLSADTGEPTEVVPIRDVVTAAIRQVAPPDGRLRVHDSGSPTARGRALDLERLFRNLIENAVRHSPEDASVDVSIVALPDRTEVSVWNDGDPIPEDERERIFEPFRRGIRESAEGRTGVGLGLAIARQITVSHGGALELAPATDRGTTFKVVLPAVAHTDGTLDAHARVISS